LISTPVMYDASCDAKNATVAATFSGCPNRFIVQLIHVRKLRDVRLHRHHAISDRSHRLVQRFPASAGDGNFCSLFLQALGGRKANSAVSAGHHGHFSFKSFHT